MPIRVAVNGFGRVGRFIVRLLAKETRDIECVAINSRADSGTLAHLLSFDSVHGHFDLPVQAEDEALILGGKRVALYRNTSNLAELPWGRLGVEIVLETSGQYRERAKAQGHLEAGAKKVIVSAPTKGADATLVVGVNHLTYDPQNHHIISNASCTTNCLAPVVKVVHEEFGLERGFMTTVHAYTMDQRLLDGSHKDLRRARAAAMSMVPTTTGAARAVTEVIPALKGRLDGLAVRVPTPNVSLVDLTAQLGRAVSAEEVNAVLKAAAENQLKGILFYSELPLVSVDYTSSPYSAILDAPLTSVIAEKMVKLMAWYDNESGFANRMVDLALFMGERL